MSLKTTRPQAVQLVLLLMSYQIQHSFSLNWILIFSVYFILFPFLHSMVLEPTHLPVKWVQGLFPEDEAVGA